MDPAGQFIQHDLLHKMLQGVTSPLSGKTVLVYDDTLLSYDFGPHHPLKPIRLKLAVELSKSIGVLKSSKVSLVEPSKADVEQILLFHTREYVNLVERSSMTGRGLLDQGDTPAFKGCFESSKLYVGGSIQASDLVMQGKANHAFNPAGGLHHAHHDRASGFCIFNDAAVVISHLKRNYHTKRILYLDVDAHHGDGVMYGFYSDPSVADIDFHEDGKYLFPGTGFTHEVGEGEAEGLKINVPLLPLTADEAYLAAFREIVPRIVRSYRPEIILMQCGADSHFDDGLANLCLSTNCYEEMVHLTHDLAHEICSGRLLLFGGGGYSLGSVARCWTLALAAMADVEFENKIPQAWAELYESLFKEEAPENLRDPAHHIRKSPEVSLENVKRVLAELKATIPMLR